MVPELKVKLLSYTPDPERLVATAAKLCYSSSDIESLRDGLTDEKTESFIDMLTSIGHESVMVSLHIHRKVSAMSMKTALNLLLLRLLRKYPMQRLSMKE